MFLTKIYNFFDMLFEYMCTFFVHSLQNMLKTWSLLKRFTFCVKINSESKICKYSTSSNTF